MEVDAELKSDTTAASHFFCTPPATVLQSLRDYGKGREGQEEV